MGHPTRYIKGLPYPDTIYAVYLRHQRTKGVRAPNLYLFTYLIARHYGLSLVINSTGIYWSDHEKIEELKLNRIFERYEKLLPYKKIFIEIKARSFFPKKED